MTPDEIQRVARWFIRPAQLSVVLVGDADKFVNDLKGVGFGTYERIPIERLDLLSADLMKRAGAPQTRVTRLLLSCGEASGDLYAGALVEALRRREPDIDVFGLGGERFAAAGGRLIADFHGLSRHRPDRSAERACRDRSRCCASSRSAAREQKPHALVVIDYPDFNFRLMRCIKKHGHPGDLLRQPAALGVARRPHQADEAQRRSRAADLSRSRKRSTSASGSTCGSSAIR